MTVESFADQLVALAGRYRDARPDRKAGLYRMDDIPEPTSEHLRAIEELRDFARRLNQLDRNLMSEVYDMAVERHGYEAVNGVSAVWTGISGWSA